MGLGGMGVMERIFFAKFCNFGGWACFDGSSFGFLLAVFARSLVGFRGMYKGELWVFHWCFCRMVECNGSILVVPLWCFLVHVGLVL